MLPIVPHLLMMVAVLDLNENVYVKIFAWNVIVLMEHMAIVVDYYDLGSNKLLDL